MHHLRGANTYNFSTVTIVTIDFATFLYRFLFTLDLNDFLYTKVLKEKFSDKSSDKSDGSTTPNVTPSGNTSKTTVKKTTSNKNVLERQKELNALLPANMRLKEDGIYGPKTKAAEEWVAKNAANNATNNAAGNDPKTTSALADIGGKIGEKVGQTYGNVLGTVGSAAVDIVTAPWKALGSIGSSILDSIKGN